MQRIDPGARPLSDDERIAIDDALDAAVAWQADELPFEEAIKVGTVPNARGNPSPEWTRALAFRCVPASDPRKAALYALSETGSRMAGKIETPHGWFTRQEWNEHEFTIRRLRKDGAL